MCEAIALPGMVDDTTRKQQCLLTMRGQRPGRLCGTSPAPCLQVHRCCTAGLAVQRGWHSGLCTWQCLVAIPSVSSFWTPLSILSTNRSGCISLCCVRSIRRARLLQSEAGVLC